MWACLTATKYDIFKENKISIYHSAYAKYCLIKVQKDHKYILKYVHSKKRTETTLMEITS